MYIYIYIYIIFLEDFSSWREDYEKRSVTQYLKDKKLSTKDGSVVEYFYCNRSGRYHSESKGKRQGKSQGTLKINNNCTSTVKATVAVDGKVVMFICHTHYAHNKQLCHVRIPESDRQNVAAKLLQGIPKKKILGSLYDNNITQLERKHILERKDLNNIAKSYGVENCARHKEDHLSVEAHVTEIMDDGTCNILLYKRQGELQLAFPKNHATFLEKNDFALGIMTPYQKNMLQKFGNNVICLDATHSTNGYDFKLITVLVIDEYGDGIPVAWLISNKEDGIILSLFLRHLKRAAGIINPQVIMSDKANQYYNSWVEAFEGQPQKLLCKFHVYYDIKKKLPQLVHEKATAAQLYKGLCLLFEEREIDKFEQMLTKSMKDMHLNEHTTKFADYFQNEWVSVKEQWAACYRVGCGINTNMHLESFHNVIKNNYLEGKYNKRLDKCLVKLFEYARDLIVKRLIKTEKNKSSWKSSEIAKRHRSAAKLPITLVTQVSYTSWKVKSSKSLKSETSAFDNLIYCVNQVKDQCEKKCHLKCDTCEVCIHLFICTCPDSTSRNMVCKHIHLVAMHKTQHAQISVDTSETPTSSNNPPFARNTGIETMTPSNDASKNFPLITVETMIVSSTGVPLITADSLTNSNNSTDCNITLEDPYYDIGKHFLLKELNKGKISSDLESHRNTVIDKLMMLVGKVHKCSDIGILNTLNAQITASCSVIEISESSLNTIACDFNPIIKTQVPHNKKMERQKGFFSTKKKKAKNNLRLAKPTFDKSIDIEQQLLFWKDGIDSLSNCDHTYFNSIRPSSEPEGKPKLLSSALNKIQVKKFLSGFLSEHTIGEILEGKKLAEENDVETVPENVPDFVIDINEQVLHTVESFFTPDGWLVVEGVLKQKKKNTGHVLYATK